MSRSAARKAEAAALHKARHVSQHEHAREVGHCVIYQRETESEHWLVYWPNGQRFEGGLNAEQQPHGIGMLFFPGYPRVPVQSLWDRGSCVRLLEDHGAHKNEPIEAYFAKLEEPVEAPASGGSSLMTRLKSKASSASLSSMASFADMRQTLSRSGNEAKLPAAAVVPKPAGSGMQRGADTASRKPLPKLPKK